jgi:2-oxoisovalerate dehydrogenase E2 component (dihydrolipoyl transacylase)
VTEAVIQRWLKKPGDRIEKYDPIVEVVTDKVAMEVPAPASGTITRIIAVEGATVPMGAVIAEMEAEEVERPASASPGTPVSHAASATPSALVAPQGARPAQTLKPPVPDRIGRIVMGANVGPTGGVFQDTSLTAAVGRPETVARVSGEMGEPAAGRYSPIVLKLAAAHGVDLSRVRGTGLGGRITKKDVLNAATAWSAATALSPAPAAPTRPSSGGEGGSKGAAATDDDRLIEPTPVRKIIAAHMARSFSEIPHAWSAIEVDVTGMVECRAVHREKFRAAHGVDLTYLPFTLHAVAQALRANPMLNSSWESGKVRLKGRVNVGVAVAAPGGLVVPVVLDADRETIAGLAKRLAPLVERARTGKLTLEDVQGGTFTLNNTGALGSVWGGAIINHPQAAIMTTEAIVKRPVVVPGPQHDTIAVHSMMNICLSFDHRVIDGAEAAAFLQDVKKRLGSITRDTTVL